MPSVRARFPNAGEGQQLLDLIVEVYAINTRVTVPFFVDGAKNLVPHECNQRKHDQIMRKYIDSVRTYGILPEVRGRCWAVAPPTFNGPLRLLTWGTLSRAAYAAFEQDRTNPKVALSMERGIPDVWAFEEEEGGKG